MGIIDIVLGALILWGLVRGFMKGLFVEVASLLALVAGIYGAIHFSHFASEFLKSKTNWDENTIHIAALAITFVIIVLAIALAGKALTKLANFAALGILNKLTGAIFGALKMALILSIVLNLFDKINSTISLVDEDRIENSKFYEPVLSLVQIIIPDIWEPTIEIIEDSPLSKDA
ncbi:CvpA family protein [Algibacter mikhailovii]|uniref:Colicin V production protein n=1 Tax=Algibacter mikhailovii TaxID=425498 RepID=A0A918R9J3_9FLAO|nr:CvpA family protein [Algibacter mikhailovii]GGZ88676.1 colicin V production protein [Algibacter mikhailovii]